MRVLLLSHTTGYQLRAFNAAAEKLGLELVFATDRCHELDDPWQDRAIAVRFHDLNESVNAIVERHLRQPVAGVIAVGDRPVVLAARAADTLGLPWHSVMGALASSDKRRSRGALHAAGLPSPEFFVLSASSASFRHRPSAIRHRVGFPCVLKPVGLSGSRGVIRADNDADFLAAFDRIRALIARPQVRSARTGLEDQILVERYVEGREFAVEGVLTRGVLRVFAIFDKPDPLEGPFFEETVYVTPSSLDVGLQARLVDQVARGAAALGLWHGSLHAECRITPDDEVYVLEIAGRPIGGLCSRVLTFINAENAVEGGGTMRAGGLEPEAASLEEVLLRHAIEQPVNDWARETQAAAVMMIPIPARGVLKSVRGEEAARSVAGVTGVRITAKIGQLLEPLPEAGSYLGFVFAKGAAPCDAELAVRDAHAKLTFEIAPEIPVNR